MGYSADQIANGEAIIAVAKALGLGVNAEVIGIMTALDESTLHNDNFGDIQNGQMTSSRGLFQQIAAWGPLSLRENPVASAYMFYTGGQEGQRGLTDIPNWQTLEPWVAAQSVQQSEFSDGSNYEKNYQAAVEFVNQYGSGSTLSSNATGAIAGGTATVIVGKPLVVNGVTIGDPVWKSYLTSNGTANFPGINVHGGGGIISFPPAAMNLKLADGTSIQLTPNDDLSALASAAHSDKNGTQLSRIDFDKNSQVVDYAGIVNQAQSTNGNPQTGGGAVSDPLLGIPDALKNAPQWIQQAFASWGTKVIYGGIGLTFAIVGIIMIGKQSGATNAIATVAKVVK